MGKIKTLCFIRKGEYVLLGRQKDTLTKEWKKGVGLWNAPGGKFENTDTSIEAAARREVQEEVRVDVPKLRKVGVMEFRFTDGECHEVHIFEADGCIGEPAESDEMVPQWFHLNEIPYDQMWPADRKWLPTFFEGRPFKGRVLFGPNKQIFSFELKVD